MSEHNLQVLAIDFGASSGRAMLGSFSGNRITMREIHRFDNTPVQAGKTLYWDVLRLLYEVKQSLQKASKYGDIAAVSVDTWGVDFGLLDADGNLIANPVHYRDVRTKGMTEKAFEIMSPDELYRLSGNQIMEINTVFQLMALKEKQQALFAQADKMLLMPDLFGYFLTGKIRAETSIASTTQMYDPIHGCWSREIADRFGIPVSLFPELLPSGSVLGELLEDVCAELMIPKTKVISVAGHDTQSAMVAVPAEEEDFVFISCGTWSLVGTQTKAPVVSLLSAKYGLTNEAAYGGKNAFLKNITGLWLIQESRRQWMKEGKTYSFSELEDFAKEAKPFQCIINPDDDRFASPGNIPERIRAYCRETHQGVPQTVGEVVRCIYESLAVKYKLTIDEISDCTGTEYKRVCIVGGGSQSALLCEMTANACGVLTTAGPVEATVLGNLGVALMTLGVIKDEEALHKIIRESQSVMSYESRDMKLWNDRINQLREAGLT